ncbi:hypothetical protein PR048_029317 [Dryococelus australis]|uniref:Uncharacterized protein n=1 Tax=Dryococelus australis TaxID=614101 RepID=A0ABQ9GFJ3_9NEOP|nr:hypothetical protein PR048_029317 [Dryococelus australis]
MSSTGCENVASQRLHVRRSGSSGVSHVVADRGYIRSREVSSAGQSAVGSRVAQRLSVCCVLASSTARGSFVSGDQHNYKSRLVFPSSLRAAASRCGVPAASYGGDVANYLCHKKQASLATTSDFGVSTYVQLRVGKLSRAREGRLLVPLAEVDILGCEMCPCCESGQRHCEGRVAVLLGARNLSYKFYFYSKASFTLPRKVVSYSAPTEKLPDGYPFGAPAGTDQGPGFSRIRPDALNYITLDKHKHSLNNSLSSSTLSSAPKTTNDSGRLQAFHLGEPHSILGGVAPEFSQMGFVPNDAAGRRVFSAISRLPPPLHSGAAPFPPHSILGSQDLDVTSHPNLSNPLCSIFHLRTVNVAPDAPLSVPTGAVVTKAESLRHDTSDVTIATSTRAVDVIKWTQLACSLSSGLKRTRVIAAVINEVLTADVEVNMERNRNEGVGETGDIRKKKPPVTNGIHLGFPVRQAGDDLVDRRPELYFILLVNWPRAVQKRSLPLGRRRATYEEE